ncbi:MAG: DMT family transporter [Alphaproteobacteria bacterium]
MARRGIGEGRQASPALAYTLLTLAALFWSGNFLLARAVHLDVPPIGLNFWRWVVALLILLPFAGAAALRHRAVLGAHFGLLLLLGGLGIAGFNSAAYLALGATTAVNGVLIVSATPVLIVLVSWLLDRRPATPRQIAGVALSLAGALVIITRGDIAVIASLGFNRGDLWMVLAITFWATYSVLLRRAPPDVPPLALLTTLVAIGLVLLLPVYVAEAIWGRPMPVTWVSAGSIAYVALFASIGAYVSWNRAVAMVGPNVSGLFLHLMPVFTTLGAVLLLDESLRLFHLPGIGLIGLGLWLATLARPQRASGSGPRPATTAGDAG